MHPCATRRKNTLPPSPVAEQLPRIPWGVLDGPIGIKDTATRLKKPCPRKAGDSEKISKWQ